MKPGTERKIQQALDSLDAIKSTGAPGGFTQKVLQKLETARKVPMVIPLRKMWMAAAAVILLLLVNVWAVSSLKPSDEAHSNKSKGEQLVTEYGLDI